MSARRARPRATPAAPSTSPPPAAATRPDPAGAPAPSFRRELAIVLLMAAVYVAIHQTLCVIKLRYYLYRDFDLAIFVQAIHGVMHGQWFSSIRGMNWLGDHSSLILIPLAPLFALSPHATTLLAMQTVALGAGAVPVWLLARRELPAGPLPVACAALWLLQPALGYLNLFEFHPETLAVPFLLWCALEVREGRLARASIAAGVALLAREDIPLPVLGLALVALLQRPRRPRVALALAGLAIASLALSFGVLKPRLLAGQAEYGLMYARWGETPAEIARGILTRPLEALSSFWMSPGNAEDSLLKQQFWLHLLLPVAGIALLAPLWLLPALPVFVEHLLAERSHQHTIVFQYTALTLPFVVVATILGMRTALRALTPAAGGHPRESVGPARAATALALALVAIAAGTQVMFGPLVGRGIWQKVARPEAIVPDAHHRSMKLYRDRMLARVPKDGAVIAGFEFLARLATHPGVHSMHHVVSGHYTYSNQVYPEPGRVGAVIADMSSQIPYMTFDSGARLRGIAERNGLKPADAAGGTLLLLAGTRDTVELWRIGDAWEHQPLDLIVDEQLLFINAVRLDSVVAPGGVARVVAYWKRLAPANRNYFSQTVLTRGRELVVQDWARALGYGIFPPKDWPVDSVVSETYHLLIPDDTPPGSYRPLFRLVSEDAGGRQETPTVRFGDHREPMNVVGLQDIRGAEMKAR